MAPSLNFRHSSLITHHSKYYTRLAPSLNFHHSIFFILFVSSILVTHCRFFFLPKLTEPSEKKKKNPRTDWSEREKKNKKKKKREETQNRSKRKKKEKKNRIAKKKGKKVKSGQKLRLVLFVGPSFVCLITILPLSLSYGNWKQLKCVLSFHNSYLKNQNWVMETELLFAKQPFCHGSYHFWVMSYENWELSYGICQSKHPLNLSH